MAEESGFFTSVAGDRKYNADFMNRKLHEAFQREDGVLACDGALAVTKTTGLGLSVGIGVAMKSGFFYRNTQALSITLSSVAIGLKRRDRVVLHLDRYSRTMKVTVLKGTESTTPVVPAYSSADDILLAQVLIEYSAGLYVTTLTDERQMRSVFITDKDSIDRLKEGQVYGRVLKAQAEAINTGLFNIAFRKFLYAGKAWTDGRDIHAFALQPNGVSMLMGTDESYTLWYSVDCGVNWDHISGINLDTIVSTIAINGAATFIGGGYPARIYRSTSMPIWTLVAENTNEDQFSALYTIDSMNMLAACSNDVYGSIDGGLTWTLRGTIQNMAGIARFESLGEDVVLAVGQGSNYICRSTDAGATWSTVKNTYSSISEYNFLKHIGNGIVLFGDKNCEWIFRSTDYGLTWNFQIRVGDYHHYPTLLVDGTKLLLPVVNSVYVSEDNGLTWTNKYPVANIRTIAAICKCSNDIIVTMSEDGDVFWGYPFNA